MNKKNLPIIISVVIFIVMVFVARQYSVKIEKQSYNETINKFEETIKKQ